MVIKQAVAVGLAFTLGVGVFAGNTLAGTGNQVAQAKEVKKVSNTSNYKVSIAKASNYLFDANGNKNLEKTGTLYKDTYKNKKSIVYVGPHKAYLKDGVMVVPSTLHVMFKSAAVAQLQGVYINNGLLKYKGAVLDNKIVKITKKGSKVQYQYHVVSGKIMNITSVKVK